MRIINYFFSYMFFVLITIVNGISTGANEPIADNELGLTAKDCAKQYCEKKDGLALWLTLQSVCKSNANPYFMELKNGLKENENNDEEEMDEIEKIEEEIRYVKITPFLAGLTCSCVSIIGLITGFRIGNYRNKNKIHKYTKLSMNEK